MFALSFVGALITVVKLPFCRSWVKDYGSKPDSSLFIWANCWPPSWALLSPRQLPPLLHNRGIARAVLGVVALGIVVIFAKKWVPLCRALPVAR